MNTFESLTNYYNTKNEHIRLSSRHGSVEFLTTVRYVEKYLFKNARILEIGAATGKYSHYFAQKGMKQSYGFCFFNNIHFIAHDLYESSIGLHGNLIHCALLNQRAFIHHCGRNLLADDLSKKVFGRGL